MKRGLCLTLAVLTLLLCTACGGNERLDGVVPCKCSRKIPKNLLN